MPVGFEHRPLPPPVDRLCLVHPAAIGNWLASQDGYSSALHNAYSWNSATTDLALAIETTHFPSSSWSQPSQPTNSEPADGVAVSVTSVGSFVVLAGGEV